MRSRSGESEIGATVPPEFQVEKLLSELSAAQALQEEHSVIMKKALENAQAKTAEIISIFQRKLMLKEEEVVASQLRHKVEVDSLKESVHKSEKRYESLKLRYGALKMNYDAVVQMNRSDSLTESGVETGYNSDDSSTDLCIAGPDRRTSGTVTLPDAVWRQIFRHSPLDRRLLLRRVSRAWHYMIDFNESSLNLRKVESRRCVQWSKPIDVRMAFAVFVPRMGRALRTLSTDGNLELSDARIDILCAHCPNLTSINVELMYLEEVYRLTSLKALTVGALGLKSESSTPVERLYFDKLACLEYMAIDGSEPFDGRLFKGIQTNALKIFRIYANEMTDADLAALIHNCPALEEVSLSRCSCTSVSLLKDLENLKILELEDCNSLSGLYAVCEARGSAIEQISVAGNCDLSNFEFLKFLTRLRVLNVRGCFEFQASSLSFLPATAPLTRFYMCNTRADIESSIDLLAGRRYSIGELALGNLHCKNSFVRLSHVQYALQEFPHLRNLRLYGNALDDDVFPVILEWGRYLCRLRITSTKCTIKGMLTYLQGRKRLAKDSNSPPLCPIDFTIRDGIASAVAVLEDILVDAGIRLHSYH